MKEYCLRFVFIIVVVVVVDDDDFFYITLFSALEQAHCAHFSFALLHE